MSLKVRNSRMIIALEQPRKIRSQEPALSTLKKGAADKSNWSKTCKLFRFFLGYVMLLISISPQKYLWGLFDLPLLPLVGYAAALALPISALVCVFVWSRQSWAYHPITAKLKHLMPGDSGSSSAQVVSDSINMELRRPDLFNTGHYSQKVRLFLI